MKTLEKIMVSLEKLCKVYGEEAKKHFKEAMIALEPGVEKDPK